MILRLLKLGVSMGVALSDVVCDRAFTLLGRSSSARRGVVLYYHGISAQHRRQFARQMDAVREVSTPVRADAVEAPAAGPCTAVTFDDGFVSVIENALPELRARRIPCTMFVPTGSLGSGPAWLSGDHQDARELVLSREQLRDLSSDDLVFIGSHSVSHPNLSHVDEARALAELQQSKSELEAILATEVATFSFPHGAYDSRTVALARQAGYRRVFSVNPSTASFAADQFLQGRVRVDVTDSPFEVRLKARGAYRWLSTASAWKRRLLRQGDRPGQPVRRGIRES